MTPQDVFLQKACAAATTANHPWPDYAACEAALESGYGTSKLAVDAANLFGCKQHRHAIYGTVNMPTREWENGEWVVVDASWVKYTDWATCFADRMATLRRLAPYYPHYAAALAAKDGGTFVIEVSKTWSSDPERASKVLAIYAAHPLVFTLAVPGVDIDEQIGG